MDETEKEAITAGDKEIGNYDHDEEQVDDIEFDEKMFGTAAQN